MLVSQLNINLVKIFWLARRWEKQRANPIGHSDCTNKPSSLSFQTVIVIYGFLRRRINKASFRLRYFYAAKFHCCALTFSKPNCPANRTFSIDNHFCFFLIEFLELPPAKDFVDQRQW